MPEVRERVKRRSGQMRIQPIVVAVVVVVVVLVATTSAVVIDKPSGEAFSASSSSSNSLPAPSSQYGAPPGSSSSGDISLQYGQPPPRPPSFSYGPPPLPLPSPPAGNSFSLKPNKYKFYSNALSLFDGECGHWKALSTFLLVIGAATGFGLLFRAWPLNFKILDFTDEDTTARLTDPAFLASVFDQMTDISRVLMNIKEANYDYNEE
ncbi:hypothetical protein E2C01_000652 [Portunus trituberculatus]|uniref:Uncharacterized protein n=1 Tax=Portunus trituberculatus TaxID=210409 RepID=A0A5B7CEY1_PORTR|nr:hypothetical protein [Portunus trituberculatus]